MRRRAVIIGGGIIVLAVGWYAFRPERLWVDQVVDESFPGEEATQVMASADEMAKAAPRPLLAGEFHTNAHETKGRATIYESDGKRVLRLTSFETSNGPDVQVYLVAAPDVNDDATVKSAGFVSLGAMKGNKGDQNYEIPAEVDLAKYRAVTIWCRRFSVNFGTAPLASTRI